MKRKFFAFIALISATLSLSSCLNSDDETVEYTQDTAITAFSLGSLDRYVKTSAGKDTLLSANVTGSNYKFYIDQTQHLIYNVDSLPCGVRDTAMLTTITSKNSSPILWMDIDKTDSVAAYYSSSDSVNFTKPRYLRVYNNDFSAYVTYLVTVNIHKELPYDFNWCPLAQQNTQLAALTDLKAIVAGSYVYVFGKTAEGMKAYRSAINDGKEWSALTTNVSFNSNDYQNAVVLDDELYILSDGKVYSSADGSTWNLVAENASIKQLIGASSQYLYAYEGCEVLPTTRILTSTSELQTTGILVSKDKGRTWTSEKLDAHETLLPTQNVSMNVSSILSTKNAEHLMLMGTRAAEKGDTIAITWNRTVDYNSNASAGQWNYMELDQNQRGKMPWLDQVTTCAADTGYVALGSNGKWYKSQSAGLTWEVDTTVVMPAHFSTSARFGFCRDEQNYYWVISNGYVWKGRHNIDGWRKE